MPLFFTPKPRQFHYDPRFYNPEKEKWEALKQKYADRKQEEAAAVETETTSEPSAEAESDDLRYFEDKVRRMERDKSRQPFGLKDLFRKREMPKFNYQPRFQQGTSTADSAAEPATDAEKVASKYADRQYRIRIRRRYDIEDPEYMKPVSAGKIMLYTLLACLLLYWILF